MNYQNTRINRKFFTVSELTHKLKSLIEDNFPFVWLSGEISNFKIPGSGHYYFTLKDKNAQINAVMFKGQNRNLKFIPEDGLNIMGFGRISLYQPRGTYQIIFEYIEPKGTGALSLAFEQLKERLFQEGLFDEQYKMPLPFLPKRITLITSPTGAVLHDMIKIINRRFPGILIEIIPVRVQGNNAAREIVAGIELLNSRKDTAKKSDAAILARGGGSMEDLSPFNSERVARAIFASSIPIISAIGHETDFTIADFTADFRAPTPSAAAEQIVPLKTDLDNRCFHLTRTLKIGFLSRIDYFKGRLDNISNRLADPGKRIGDARLKTDDYSARLNRLFKGSIVQKQKHLAWLINMLHANSPAKQIRLFKAKNDQMRDKSIHSIDLILMNRRSDLKKLTALLYSLNPLEILSRGYSIVRTTPGACVITDSSDVTPGQKLEVILAKGSLTCRVERKKDNG